MISEGSCDTEDWSNDQIDIVCLNYKNKITKWLFLLYFYNQISAVLVSRSGPEASTNLFLGFQVYSAHTSFLRLPAVSNSQEPLVIR